MFDPRELAKTLADREIHVVPTHEKDKHFDRRDCPCAPYLDYKDPNTLKEVWVHNRRDN